MNNRNGHRGRPRRQAQMALDEEPLEDLELARLLDDREGAKEEMAPYVDAYRGLDKQVKGLIAQKDLPDGLYRCGDFVVSLKETDSREVSFERASSRSIRIRPAKT